MKQISFPRLKKICRYLVRNFKGLDPCEHESNNEGTCWQKSCPLWNELKEIEDRVIYQTPVRNITEFEEQALETELKIIKYVKEENGEYIKCNIKIEKLIRQAMKDLIPFNKNIFFKNYLETKRWTSIYLNNGEYYNVDWLKREFKNDNN